MKTYLTSDVVDLYDKNPEGSHRAVAEGTMDATHMLITLPDDFDWKGREPERVQSQLPSVPSMAASAVKSFARTVARAVTGQQVVATAEEQARRQGVCGTCEHFDAERRRCTKCGCFANAENWLLNKWKWETEKCPEGKW